MSQKNFLLIASTTGFTAVVLGAFGAHALRSVLSEEMLRVYDKAVLYQFIHTASLLVIGLLPEKYYSRFASYAGICFALGILFFCGSLYLLTVAEWKFMGPVTPIGGLFFLAGWFLFAFNIYNTKEK